MLVLDNVCYAMVSYYIYKRVMCLSVCLSKLSVCLYKLSVCLYFCVSGCLSLSLSARTQELAQLKVFMKPRGVRL